MRQNKRKSLSGDRKKRANQSIKPSSFNRNRDLPKCLDSSGSSFSIILRCLFYKKPILPEVDVDFLMRQCRARMVDRANWQFTY